MATRTQNRKSIVTKLSDVKCLHLEPSGVASYGRSHFLSAMTFHFTLQYTNYGLHQTMVYANHRSHHNTVLHQPPFTRNHGLHAWEYLVITSCCMAAQSTLTLTRLFRKVCINRPHHAASILPSIFTGSVSVVFTLLADPTGFLPVHRKGGLNTSARPVRRITTSVRFGVSPMVPSAVQLSPWRCQSSSCLNTRRQVALLEYIPGMLRIVGRSQAYLVHPKPSQSEA